MTSNLERGSEVAPLDRRPRHRLGLIDPLIEDQRDRQVDGASGAFDRPGNGYERSSPQAGSSAIEDSLSCLFSVPQASLCLELLCALSNGDSLRAAHRDLAPERAECRVLATNRRRGRRNRKCEEP